MQKRRNGSMLMGQDTITWLRLQKNLKVADFRPKVTSRNLSEKGVNFFSRILAMCSPFLLGQWFQVIKNSLSWLLMSKDGTNWCYFFFLSPFSPDFSKFSSIKSHWHYIFLKCKIKITFYLMFLQIIVDFGQFLLAFQTF